MFSLQLTIIESCKENIHDYLVLILLLGEFVSKSRHYYTCTRVEPRVSNKISWLVSNGKKGSTCTAHALSLGQDWASKWIC